MLFFVPNLYLETQKLPSVVTCSLYIHTDLVKILSSLLNGAILTGSVTRYFPKIALFSVLGLKDEKLIKKSKPARKLKHANFILKSFEHFSQMSPKSILIISTYTVPNFVRFLRHSV